MDVGPRLEASYLHGIVQAVILRVADMNVTKREEEKMHQFVRNPQMTQRVYESKNRLCSQHRDNHENNGIRFQGDEEGSADAFTMDG